MTKMPTNVLRFERLMYLSLIIGIAFGLVHLRQRFIAEHGVIAYVVGTAIVVGLYTLGIWSAARRRKNFVRWLLLALLILGLLMTLKNIVADYRTDPALVVEQAIQTLIQGLALCFVFSREARPWFQKQPAIDPDIFS